MKKLKAMVLCLVLVLSLVGCGKSAANKAANVPSGETTTTEENNTAENNMIKKSEQKQIKDTETTGNDIGRAIMIDDVVYYDTGIPATPINYDLFVGVITSECEEGTIPTENQQSNFGTGYEYQAGDSEGQIKVKFEDGTCIIFATEEVKNEMEKN